MFRPPEFYSPRSLMALRRATVVGSLILLCNFSVLDVSAQDKLKLKSQRELSTFENTPITLKLSDFTVEGPGADRYPEGFAFFEHSAHIVGLMPKARQPFAKMSLGGPQCSEMMRTP